MVYSVAYKWCGNREQAEDVTHDVFIKLARTIGQFRFGSAFTTWLYRIVVNTTKNVHARHQLQTERYAQYSDITMQHEPASQETTIAAQQAFALLDSLPQKHKQAVLLVLCEGLSHKEAADISGCAETTISWRLFQAKKQLKKLAEKGGFNE